MIAARNLDRFFLWAVVLPNLGRQFRVRAQTAADAIRLAKRQIGANLYEHRNATAHQITEHARCR